METIRAVIIEDEPKAGVMLKTLLEKYCTDVHIIGEASNVKEGVELINKVVPNLVFLDIEMPDEQGLHLFKYFDKINFEVIFTTAYDQYVINALRLSALDYLLKPIDLNELQAALEQFRSKKHQEQLYKLFYNPYSVSDQNKSKRLALPSKDSFTFLNIEDVMYCQADSNYTIFVDKNAKKHIVSRSIKEYSDLLEQFGFLRVHRSAVVNLSFIKKMIRTRPCQLIMQDDNRIRVSQSRRQYLFDVLTKG